MGDQKLSGRYAKSLIDLAKEKDKLEEINNDMRLFDSVLKSSRDFLLMLRNPIIQADKKIKIIEEIFKDKWNPVTLAFFTLVIKKGRESHLPGIAEAFIEQYNTLKRILRVKVTTAVAVNQELIDRVTQIVKEKTGIENIEMTTKIDPNIIGGFILQYEDKLYDTSILRNLDVVDDNFEENIYQKKF